jgi:hypothetical protein
MYGRTAHGTIIPIIFMDGVYVTMYMYIVYIYIYIYIYTY